MKKIISLIALLGLTSCSSIYKAQTNKYVKTVDYVCPMDTTFKVKFYKGFDKIDLETASDEVFTLTNKSYASGVYYSNENGVYIHSKGDEAIIEIIKDKPIQCTIF